jgi:hypothetical protein
MKEYIKEKEKLLNEMGIFLTGEEKTHIRSLTSEIAVDNFAHDLILKGPRRNKKETKKPKCTLSEYLKEREKDASVCS